MRGGSDLSRRYGPLGEAGAWAQVSEHYHWDRLEEASLLAAQIGAGERGIGTSWMRLIEAEAMTRAHAEVLRVNEWLELEHIPSEAERPREIGERIEASCLEVCEASHWKPGPPVRAVILAADADTPWTPGRHGFCVDKHPYDKICFPASAARDPGQLEGTARHEFAHVMALNRAQGRCPTWLDEAVAMLADSGPAQGARHRFRRGQWAWQNPRELDAAFGVDRSDQAGQAYAWQAYQQSALIGQGLQRRIGSEGIGRLLDRLGESPPWSVIWSRIRGESWIDRCLRIELGLDERSLFEEVLGSL